MAQPTLKQRPEFCQTKISSGNISVYTAGTNKGPALELREKSEGIGGIELSRYQCGNTHLS